MTPIVRAVFVLLVVACLICLGAMFAIPTSVRSQDIPPCVDADAFVAEMLKADPSGREHPPLELETHRTDKSRYVEAGGVVWLLLTNHGCLMTRPVFYDYAKDRGDPA